MSDRTCAVCGKIPTDGAASIITGDEKQWYCHDDEQVTCYMRAVMGTTDDALETVVKERDHFRIGVQEFGKAIRDLGIKLHQAERERDDILKTLDAETAAHNDTIRELAEQLKIADRQFTRLKESSGKAAARAVELAAVVEKIHSLGERLINYRRDEWVEIDASEWDQIISAAPAEALREVKAQTWHECIEAVQEATNNALADHLPPDGRVLYVHNPYRKEQENNNA